MCNRECWQYFNATPDQEIRPTFSHKYYKCCLVHSCIFLLINFHTGSEYFTYIYIYYFPTYSWDDIVFLILLCHPPSLPSPLPSEAATVDLSKGSRLSVSVLTSGFTCLQSIWSSQGEAWCWRQVPFQINPSRSWWGAAVRRKQNRKDLTQFLNP